MCGSAAVPGSRGAGGNQDKPEPAAVAIRDVAVGADEFVAFSLTGSNVECGVPQLIVLLSEAEHIDLASTHLTGKRAVVGDPDVFRREVGWIGFGHADGLVVTPLTLDEPLAANREGHLGHLQRSDYGHAW